MKQKILQIICIIIGIVFIVSGLGKIVDTAAFGNLIAKYGFVELHIFAPVIALVEVAVGVSLVLGIKPKIMLYVSFGLLLMFTAAFTYSHIKNGITDCGCFGAIKLSQDNVALVYTRNVLLLGLSLFAGLLHTVCLEKTVETKKTILLGVLLPAIFVAGLTYRIPSSFRRNKSHILLNMNIKETPLHQYIQTVPDSTYLIFFYTYTCPHCLNSMENFKHFKRSNVVDSSISFALIGTDSIENKKIRSQFADYFGHFGTREILNDHIVQSFINVVPTAFYVKNDTIKNVIESQLPSPVLFMNRQKKVH